MKKYITVFLLVLFAGKTFSQIDTATSHTSIKTDYLKKSKTQKTVAWVLVAAGTSLIVIGGIIGTHGGEEVNFNDAATGGGLIVAGVLMDLGSIPLFIAGAKNKRRAMSVTINSDFVPRLQQGIIARVPIPTVGLRIKL
jgi:hypothetical protein